MSKRKAPKNDYQQYRAIAEFYDAEYESSDVLDNDAPFLLHHMPGRSQRVLELCCGTGRAAIPLAQAGHRVTGVDIDPHLLAIARRKRDGVGLSEKELRLVKGDVLRSAVPGPFDWAFLIFNTFLNFVTLADQDRLLRNVRQSLRKGGRFWIDIFNPDLSILAVPHHEHYDSATFFVPAMNRSVHRTTEIERAADRPQLQHVTFHYSWAGDDGGIETADIAFDVTWMMPRELVLLLERHGFVVEALYGDYDRSAVTPDSPRIIALAKKR